MTNVIYALQDPITEHVRYVGKAKNLKHRVQNHLTPGNLAKTKHSSRWLTGLKKKGFAPNVLILEETEHDWKTSEQDWIAYFKFVGADLTNITSGGEGGATYGRKNKPWSDTQRQAYTKSRKGVPTFSTPEGIKARSEANKKAWIEKRLKGIVKKGPCHTEESKAAISKKHLGKKLSPEHIEKMKVAKTGIALLSKRLFSSEDVENILELYQDGFTQIVIAKVFKTTQANISNIIVNKGYKTDVK